MKKFVNQFQLIIYHSFLLHYIDLINYCAHVTYFTHVIRMGISKQIIMSNESKIPSNGYLFTGAGLGLKFRKIFQEPIMFESQRAPVI